MNLYLDNVNRFCLEKNGMTSITQSVVCGYTGPAASWTGKQQTLVISHREDVYRTVAFNFNNEIDI